MRKLLIEPTVNRLSSGNRSDNTRQMLKLVSQGATQPKQQQQHNTAAATQEQHFTHRLWEKICTTHAIFLTLSDFQSQTLPCGSTDKLVL